jgi:hypothetical protein
VRIRKLLVVLLASGCTAASLLTPASADTTGPAIDNASMMNGGRPCSSSNPPQLGHLASQLEVLGTDPNPPFGYPFTYSYAIWPVSDPTAVTTFTTTNYAITDLARGLVPGGTLVSGTSYSWHVQLTDGNGTSPWSQTCTFGYDDTPPQTPTISSSNFPPGYYTPGPISQLAQFTLDGNGDPDTVGFDWTWGNILGVRGCSSSGSEGQLVCPDPLSVPGIVRTDSPGGTASLALSPPSGGPLQLTIAAVDRAGNESPQVSYQLYALRTNPIVTVSDQPICGKKTTVSFAPNAGLTDVVSYTYALEGGDGQSVDVRADRNGLATATVDVSSQPYALVVSSVSSTGFRSTFAIVRLDLNPQPTVSSDVYTNYGQPTGGVGIPGTFTFNPPFDGHQVTGYQYRFHTGPTRTVAVDPNSRSATIQYTPTKAGTDTLTVQSINGDSSGGSCSASYSFVVASPAG